MEWILDGSTVVATVLGAGTPAGTFSTSWTETTIADGSHTLAAKATRAGQSTSSPTINITVITDFAKVATANGGTVVASVQSDLGITIGTGVSAWADQSGNGNNYSQATGSKQPARNAAALNGFATVQTDGIDDQLDAASINMAAPGSTPFCYYIVARTLTWTSGKGFCGNTSGTAAGVLSMQVATPALSMYCGSNVNNNSGAAVNTWCRFVVQFTNSTGDFLRAGASTVTGANAGNSDPSAGFTIGAYFSGSAQFGKIEIASHMILTGTYAMGAGAIAALDSAVALKYGGLVTL